MTAENEVPEVRKVEIEDLINVGGDSNLKELVEEGEPEAAKVNSNGAGKDDSDGSYVFVGRSDDSANGDPADLSLEDGQESPTREYSVNSLTKGIEQVGELNVEDVQGRDLTEGAVKEQIIPDSAPESGENLDTKGVPEDQSAKSTELEQLDAEVAVKEQILPDLVPQKEEILDAEGAVKEQPVSDLAPQKVENLEAPIEIDDGKLGAEGETANSETIPVLEKVSEDLGQASSESTSRVGEVEERRETEGLIGESELTSDLEKVSESVDQDSSESALKLEGVTESPAVVVEVGDLQDGVENPQEQDNLDSGAHSQESEMAEDLVQESSKYGKEDEATVEISAGTEECAVTQDTVSDSTERKHSSPEVENAIEEKESLLEAPADSEKNLESTISEEESVEVKLINGEDVATDTEGTQGAVDVKIKGVADHGSGAGQVASLDDVPPEAEIANELVLENKEDRNTVSEVEKSISLSEVGTEPSIGSDNSSAQIDSIDCVEKLPSSEIVSAESLETCHGAVGKPEEEKNSNAGSDIKDSSSQGDMILNISGAKDEGSKPAELAHKDGELLGTERANEPVLDKTEASVPTSEVENTPELKDTLIASIDGRQNTVVSSDSIDSDAAVHSSTDCKRSDIEVGSDTLENFLPSSRIDAGVEKTDTGDDGISQSCDSASIEINPVDSKEVTDLNCANVIPSVEVPTATTHLACGQSLPDDGLHTSISVPNALNGIDAETAVSPGGAKDKEDLSCQDKDEVKLLHPEEISTASSEVASADVLDEQCSADEVLRKPFNYLIKLPRYDDDDNLREQIKLAQSQVDEKTQQRDAIRLAVHEIKGNCQKIYESHEDARREGRAIRLSIKLKRQEIESLQTVINRVKNAMAVDDIDTRVRNMEHMMQHDTLLLKEEKQCIREIKQMKQLRDQLVGNMGTPDEVKKAMEQREQIDEQMKALKKELEKLKETLTKSDTKEKAIAANLQAENAKLQTLHDKYKALDSKRQEAYAHLQNMKRQFYEKNSRFRLYKDDAARAHDFAVRGDNEALYNHCFKQVEEVMGLWNKDEQFRNEYIRCNIRSTLRRFRTLDGRALGPDEEPPLIPIAVDERTNRSISTPGKADSKLVVPSVGQEKQVINVAVEEKDVKPIKSLEKVTEPLKRTTETKNPSKPAPSNVPADISVSAVPEELSEEDKKRKEEEEKARKEEILRKEEEAAKLKEQRRLEEIAKAKEALERKRRNAEKAQIRAQLRAQKEAEEKEKEKEKRARKKGKKKGAAGESADGDSEREIAPVPEATVLATKEPEAKKEAPKTVTKRPNQYTKPKATIPPPLRNRNKKKMQQYLWMALAVAAVMAVFFIGNMGFYSNFGRNLGMKYPGF